MSSDSKQDKSMAVFQRISKVLDYIHHHIEDPMTLDELAQQSCWSRWQLQRVFQNETGTTVANYVRELKLSEAAERLLDGEDKVIDIGYALGFGSEVSFSRAFKHKFGVSPRAYRQAGQRTGLRKPLQASSDRDTAYRLGNQAAFVHIRVESKPAFFVRGSHGHINGLFSPQPNFATQVPLLWQQLEQALPDSTDQWQRVGVVDTQHAQFDATPLTYWAGIELCDARQIPDRAHSSMLSTLSVPAQTYAVVTHKGPIRGLPDTLEWFILNWLPSSNYRGVDGFELEVYPAHYHSESPSAEMEYWLPIELR